MANLARSPKSGSDWTPNDLAAYNIRVEYQDSRAFFGIADLPQPHVDDEVMNAPDAAATQRDEPYTLLRTMDLAMAAPYGEESAVDDFAVQLFKMLGYTGRALGRVARTRKDIAFWVCGQERHVKTDVCIMDDSEILDDFPHPLLLVQEDKRHLDQSDPEPQLVAEAIAALYHNNRIRVQALGVPALESRVIPGIIMKGTMPTFYRIPVTTELVRAVQMGEYPEQETVVYAHVPSVPRPARRYSEGMKPLDNRRIVLSCYEAFKQFL
ncbi:hypothetical protein GLOTRDRAFT_37590 [Gloeophyllum trabeum ATCC 11539]|uniref:Uncharacterized protein n=1 Tax=Gloeophyllum trabeum (strain ATCC 11539 / FP-39264 / Madison 617) TaxID=670483 RepID=S7RUQ1_GLOTA|nr:uncharacterized protein GLOTRDRAFT_37590 [Gloeophyllum trabeum ATCC 11539]EPQ56934.1 hypothetical protein GLOTRDRAFT_37590 [Gloeophyllum trabeum ATCC 11539]